MAATIVNMTVTSTSPAKMLPKRRNESDTIRDSSETASIGNRNGGSAMCLMRPTKPCAEMPATCTMKNVSSAMASVMLRSALGERSHGRKTFLPCASSALAAGWLSADWFVEATSAVVVSAGSCS